MIMGGVVQLPDVVYSSVRKCHAILYPVVTYCGNFVASSLAPPSFPSLACSMEKREGLGIIYHVSDVVEEDLIERRRIVELPTHEVDR